MFLSSLKIHEELRVESNELETLKLFGKKIVKGYSRQIYEKAKVVNEEELQKKSCETIRIISKSKRMSLTYSKEKYGSSN
jgi:hypothetical protein